MIFKGIPETRTPFKIGKYFSRRGERNAPPFHLTPCDRAKRRVWRLTCAADLRPKQTHNPHSGRVCANVPRLYRIRILFMKNNIVCPLRKKIFKFFRKNIRETIDRFANPCYNIIPLFQKRLKQLNRCHNVPPCSFGSHTAFQTHFIRIYTRVLDSYIIHRHGTSFLSERVRSLIGVSVSVHCVWVFLFSEIDT